MRKLLLTLVLPCYLFTFHYETFSQQKLVKCYEKGKVVYRTKCKVKKHKIIAKRKKVKKNKKVDYDKPTLNVMPSDGSGDQGGGQGTGNGRGGIGIGSGRGDNYPLPNTPKITSNPDINVKILSKPAPVYTEEARKNNIQGVLRLRVTFLGDRSIGSVIPVSGLPFGLTERAIEAAKKIKFKPAMKDRKPVTVNKVIEYSFTLY